MVKYKKKKSFANILFFVKVKGPISILHQTEGGMGGEGV
jgi:hypothetical protein